MRLSVVTPERTLVDREVTEVTAPGAVGQMGVLPDHITFLGSLDTGEIRYSGAGASGTLIMAGGVIEVRDNDVTILADDAMAPSEVDVEAARRDLADAEERIGELDPYGDAHAAATAARRWAQLRIDSAS